MNWSEESIESYAEAKNLIDLVLPSSSAVCFRYRWLFEFFALEALAGDIGLPAA